MMKIVIDTNVLVSALVSPESNPAKVLALALNGRVAICYDSRIILEYEDVLRRPKFPFEPQDVTGLIETITQMGTAAVAEPLPDAFTDQTDKKFYEVAKHCSAKLVTGNIKHFSDDSDVITPADFLKAVISVFSKPRENLNYGVG